MQWTRKVLQAPCLICLCSYRTLYCSQEVGVGIIVVRFLTSIIRKDELCRRTTWIHYVWMHVTKHVNAHIAFWIGMCYWVYMMVDSWAGSKHGWEESSCGRFRITTHPLFSAYCGPSCRMLVSKDKEYRVQTWLSSASDEQSLRKIKQQLGTKAQGQMGPLWFVSMLMLQCFGVNVFPSWIFF